MYLSLKDIVKVFAARGGVGEVAAVNHISLEIEKGELVTLLGPSGCGKTTTLRMIAGFEFPTAGSISLDGREINMLPPNKRDMSMVFQSYAIFPHLNVYENVAYGLNVRHVTKEDVKRRVATVLELVQLTGYENRAPNQLSGGQQQRVALARALVMEPKVLLMDEPLSNLDAKLREQMRTEIRRIQRDIGITSVYVTHDQVEAMTLSDRVVVMNQGIIEQVGAPQEIYRYPKTRFVADFIGRANFLDAHSLGGANGNMLVDFAGHQLALVDVRQQQPAGTPVTLIVRPEMVHVRDQGLLQGVVRRASFLGNLIDYEIEINGSLISAVETDPTRMAIYPEGSSVGVDFANECIHVLPA